MSSTRSCSAAEPAKRRPGYANFAIADPPLKLVLIESSADRGHGTVGALNHLGIEVETTERSRATAGRLSGEGLATATEEATSCCYAVQDKVGSRTPTAHRGRSTPCWPTIPTTRPAQMSQPEWRPVAAGTPRLRADRVRLRAAERPAETANVWPPAWVIRRSGVDWSPNCLGSAFLAAIVIGSGIAAQQLSPGNVGLQLFENAAATAAGLYAIILMFGPVSGAHFNPVVSFVDATFGGRELADRVGLPAGPGDRCIGGAMVANLMFSKAAVSISTKHRASPAHFLSEVVATLGLILVIFALARSGRSRSAAAAVGAYIGAAYFFTSSTSFANPAISVGRMFSNTFAGIAPSSVPSFVVAQVVGGAFAVVVIKVLYPDITSDEAADIMFPRHRPRRPSAHRPGEPVVFPVPSPRPRRPH